MERIRRIKTTICFVLALLTVDVEGRMRPAVRRSLNQISTSMSSAGKNVQTKVGQIRNYLESDTGSDQVEAVGSAIETIGGAVSSLTSDNTMEIVSGSLTVISAVSSFIPVVGPIVSVVFSLIGTIFGAIAGGGGEDVGTVVRREIERALNNYDDSQLRAEAAGTIRVYRISHAYLASQGGDAPINEHEITAISANVPVYNGIRFIGMLAQKVREKSHSTDREQVKRAMQYLQLYVTLAVMRSSLLWELYALMKAAPDSDWTADAIKRVAVAEDDHDKNFLSFLLEPEYSQAIFFAYFNPSEWPQTRVFMEKKDLAYPLDHLDDYDRCLRPDRWTNWYLYMMNNDVGLMAGTTTLDAQGLFYFETISREDNIFHIRSKRWPAWYVYMRDRRDGFCRGWEGVPGPAGEWKVIRFKDGKYMLSPKRWPNWFIYMMDDDDALIRGWNGDPGIQGHWLID